ncbi:MAG TPA: single-stranded-DNA-specific exonuclease RecJ [Gammaproteobacteria bacterium]|nr:single-stranded-DNA-specific exonuclease RecJ [Gammaproteobacteria bacterium]
MVVEYSNLEKCDRQIILKDSLAKWCGSKDYCPILQKILLNRGLTHESLINYQLKGLLHYQGLKGMNEAVSLLLKHLDLKSSVLIIGDYDVDGATSTAVAIRGLQILSPDITVNFLVPNRFEFGYGLTVPLVHEAMKLSPDLIITVDNGIVAHEASDLVRQKGVDLLITDHHLSDGKLPNCNALINPNQPGDTFASKHLAGVGVMFYTLLALRAELRKVKNMSNYGSELVSLLDFVALGTIADCVVLDENNRILVSAGLAAIRSGRAHKGIESLLNIDRRNPSMISAQDLAFGLAPKLNAAGRMDDMSLGIQCLLSNDLTESMRLANHLKKQNDHRKVVELAMRKEAENQLNNSDIFCDQESGLALYNHLWHEGVVGLIASKVKDKYQLPTIAFAQSKNGLLKGSARSLPGVHIREVLSRVDQKKPGLMKGYGGHAMAAGLSIATEDFSVFRSLFNEVLEKEYNISHHQEGWVIDAWLEPHDCKLSLVESIESLGPFGQGFPRPIFACDMNLAACREMGESHLRMQWVKSNTQLEAVWFNTDHKKLDFHVGNDYSLVFELNINFYKGIRSLQLILHDVKTAE